MDNVYPGEYRIVASPLPAGVYVKEARFGNIDVLNQPMVVAGSVSDSLEILLSPKAARIDGTVVDSQSKPVPGIQAVLIPERRPNRIDLYKTAVTDQTGHFSLQSIPPGDYKVLAWESIEPFEYFDPDFMRLFEQKGTPVHLSESAVQTIEVTMIPVGKN